MKLQSRHDSEFRGNKGPLEIDFASIPASMPRPVTCLVGDNGSGKTTVLQAVALVLSLATRRTRFLNEFNWHGYIPERISSQGPTRIELKVSLDEEEVALTQRLFQEWCDLQNVEWLQSHKIVKPSNHGDITLIFENGKLTSDREFRRTVSIPWPALHQIGRETSA